MGPISSSFSYSNISHPSLSSLPKPSTSPPEVDSQPKKVPFTTPPPSMSHGLAAHFLAGGENADLFIGSAKLEGFSQQHMLAYFRHVLENQSKSTGIEKDPKVEQLLEEIAGALELEDAIQKLHTHHLKWEDRAKAFIQLMQERIQTLKPGQSLLIPGGWTQAVVGASGHAMLYRVTKTADDSFSFEIYNTGAGVEHHPTAVIEGRELHAQKIIKKDLQTEQICSPLFWQAHYELKYAPAKDCGLITSKQVYNCFDLMAESFVETASQETLSSSDLEIRREQTTGNCSYESLLAYTKIQLGKSTDLSGRSLYHTLKLGMQLQVLEEYFDYLTQQHFFTEPTSAEEASTRLRILHLIRAEIHAVQRTLLREKSKRSLQLSSKEQQNIEEMIHNCNKKICVIEETSIVCKSKLNVLFTQPDTLSIDSSTFPITVPPGKSISVDEALKLIPNEKTTKKCIPLTTTLLSSTKEIVDALAKVESLSDTILQDIPNVEDACWDTLENPEKILPSLFRIIQLYTDDTTKHREYAIGDVIPAIKLMAICVKIVQKQKIPFLSETNLFSKKFLDSIFSKQENIISVSAKTHDDFFKSKKFLYDLSSEKCIFDEWLQLQPFEGSNQYDETFYSDTEKLPYLFTEVQKYLKKNDKLFQEFKEHIAAKNQQSPEQVPEIAVILEFITSNKMDYFLEFQQSLFLIFQHNKCKTQKLEYDLSKTNDKYKLKYKISDDSNLIPKIFHEISANYSTSLFQQDWDAIASEKELRNSCKNLLDFECNSIISCDDRSLSIFNALNFFTKNLDLLKNQTYRTFLLNVIFGRLNQEGFSLSDELKSNKKLGKSIISFVKKGLNSTINNPDQLGFFLLIRNSLIEFDEQFSLDIKVKKEIPLPSQKHLIKLIKSHYSTVLVHSLIKEESLTNYQEIVGELLLESIKEYSFFDYSYYKLNNKLFSQLIDKFFTSTKQLDLNKFLSKHLSHTKEPEEWVYQYPHASSKNIRLNINNFTATNLGTTESTSSFVSGFWENHCIKHPSFQEKFPLKNKKITEQNVKLSGFASGKYSFIFSGFFVDENGTRYFFKPTSDSSISTDSPEYYEFYIQQGDVLLSSLSIKSLGPHLEHLGISESAGWQAISDGSEIRFLNPTGALALTYNISTHILRDINTGLIATDMTQKLPPCYSSFLDLDPHAQLWKASASSVPSRITLPTFGMTFEIRNGKIWGTGEWEGFQLAKEQHLSALRGFGAKLVLHHEKLGTKVLVAEGEMSSSLDLTKPMSFKTHTDSKKKLLCLSVDTKKRLISTNREEDLYLARLFYHLGRPKAAMRCLEKCKGSNPWTLEQLRSLKTLLNDAEKRTTLSDRSVYLKAALLGINSRKAPYKKWSGTTTSEKSELNALNFTISSSAVDPYWTQITRIASPSLRLTLEEESMLHRLPTTELQVPTSSKKILDTCLLSADHFDREKISLKRPVQLDLFDHTTIPFTENWDSLSSHFLDFYAIATQGSEKQKQQLALWVKGLIFSTNISSDFAFQQKNGFAILFLRLLAMNHQQIAELPVMTSEICADEKNFTKSCEEILKSIKTVKISSEKESVAPFGSVSFSHRPVSLRKKKLMLSRLTGDTQLQSKTDTFTEIADTEKTTPLSKKSDVLFTQGKSPTEPPLSSLIPLDPKGGKTYDLAFDRFATHLKDVQKAKHSAPIWEISPENLDLLHKDLAEDTSGQIPILAKLFRESQQALIKKARTLGLDKEAVSIRELEEASRFVAPIRWSDLLFLFAKRDANAYCLRQPHFTQAQAQELFEDTAKCLALQTQLQKAEKAKELVEELQKTPDPKKTSQLKQLLTGTRDYPVDRFPAILLFEAVTGMQLREDQLQNLEKLGDPNQSWLIEAIMGSGKSEVLIPLFAQTIADGQHLSFAVMPKEQMLSGGTRLEKKLRQYFEQNSIQIDWNNTSLENLQAIHARLKEAIEKKEVVRLYADELQQFFLQEQAVWNSRFQGNPDAMPILQEFSAIRKLLKEKGVALVDEVHLQLMRKRECQKPLGEKVPVNASFCHVTADLQLLLVQDPTIQQTFRFEFSKNPQKTAVPFSAELHQKEFIRLLSTSFSRKRYEKDLGKQQKVLAFLQSPLEAPISLDTTFTEEEKIALAFARGQIQTILPSTLSKKWGQEYGLFPAQNRNEAPSLLAGPYRGLGRPVIGSTFATPDELLAYTIQSYLVEGLPKAQIAQQISSLVTRARREAATYRRPIDKTAGYQEYRQLIGETQLQQPGFAFDEEKDLDAIKKHLEENPERLIYFLKRFVLSEVSQYPTTTIANGYSFVDLFHATKAVSGTLQAAPTFHQSFRRALKPEIEAEAFALITRDNHKPICLQEKIEGIPLLKQLFSQRSKTTPRALIDQAGLIKEPPFVIAQQLLELTSTSDPKIDRIIYFEEDQLLSLERGKTTPTKYHPDACPPDTSFTFYDQAHATGTDIQQMQKAQALVTLGENTTFGDAIQAAFRMRGLDTLQQSVILVTSHELTSSLKAHLKKEPSDWNAADVLSHTKHIQVKIAEEENCKAVLDKLRNLFIKTCKEEMESETQSDQAKAELFQMTLRESRMDPLAAYTSKNELVDTKAIFTKIQIEYEKKLQGKIPPEKLRSMLGQMDTIIQEATDPTNPLVPEKILSKPNTTEAMEVEMLQEQQMELNTEQEQEQQQQQQKDLSVIPVDFATSGLPGQKTPLFTPEAAETIDLEKQSTQTTLPEDSFKDSSSIYSFSALAHFGIQKKADKTIDPGTWDQLTKDFPKKIFFSLNATIAHSDCPPFRKNQLTLDKLLLIPDPKNPKEPYCIALSKAESELWYQAIQNKKLPKGWEGSCLFSVEKEANAGEKEDGICIENEEIPFPIQELRSSFFDPSLTPFEQIIAKTKWIMGETELYHRKEETYLTHWFQSLGPKNMEAIFKSWFQISRKPYATSLLERFFKNALEESVAVSDDGSKSTIISPVKTLQTPLPNSSVSDSLSEHTKQERPSQPPETLKKDVISQQRPSFARRAVFVLFFPFYAVGMAFSWPFRWLWRRFQK